ncbi:hypothetical protein STEG23_000064, partial [Scotinomys teguina]
PTPPPPSSAQLLLRGPGYQPQPTVSSRLAFPASNARGRKTQREGVGKPEAETDGDTGIRDKEGFRGFREHLVTRPSDSLEPESTLQPGLQTSDFRVHLQSSLSSTDLQKHSTREPTVIEIQRGQQKSRKRILIQAQQRQERLLTPRITSNTITPNV